MSPGLGLSVSVHVWMSHMRGNTLDPVAVVPDLLRVSLGLVVVYVGKVAGRRQELL